MRSGSPKSFEQAGSNKSGSSLASVTNCAHFFAAREVLVRSRVKIENEIRGLLRTFGILFGKMVGGLGAAPIKSLPASLMRHR